MYEIFMSAIKKDFIPTEEEIEQIVSRIAIKNIIADPLGAVVAKYIDDNHKTLPTKAQYWLVRSVFHHKNKIKTISVPSKKDENIDLVMQHYNVSYDVAREYLALLDDKDLQEIRNFYKEGRSK